MILTKIQIFGFFNLLILSIFSYDASASLCGTLCDDQPDKEILTILKKQHIIDTGIFEITKAVENGLGLASFSGLGCGKATGPALSACAVANVAIAVGVIIYNHYDADERKKLEDFVNRGNTGTIEVTAGTLALDVGFDYEFEQTEITVLEASPDPDNDIPVAGTLAIFSLFTPADFDGAQLANIDNVVSFSSFHSEVDHEPTSYALKVRKTGTGSGIVKSNSLDIDCGSDCIEEYASAENVQVILSAFADNGSVFRGWNGACLDTGTCTVSMYNNKNITATFAIDTPSTFTVRNLEDSGVGSLRQAIIDANDNPGDDIISFLSELTGTITLTTGQLIITDSVSINGTGANRISISGNNATRIFQIKSGSTRTVNLNGLTLKEGHDKTGNGGGAIITESGTITISDCAIINNTANSGGGGGGLRKFGSGVVTIINTLISGNSAVDEFQQGDGGGIRNDKGKLTLINSTVSDNTAATGGGIASNEGVLEINNSTITGNSAINFGGGIDSNSEIVIANSLVVGNSASSENEISFFSFDGQTFISRGHNIFGEKGISGITPDLTLVKSDSILVAPLNNLIEPLADNGGTTLTHLPVEGGIAIDAGDNDLISKGIVSDQRGGGFTRINNGVVDIGAVEKDKITISDGAHNFRFTYNNHTYDVITIPKNWRDASIEAGSQRVEGSVGYLVHINDESENKKIIDELNTHLLQSDLTHTQAFDGGLGLEAVWLGANDVVDEGVWLWQDDNSQFWQGAATGNETNGLYNNWGKENAGNEPNDYTGEDSNGQDAGAIRLTDWVFGQLGEWDDVSETNSLFYIIEYDSIEHQTKTPFYKNRVLEIPNVFVADGNGCLQSYTAKLALTPITNPLSFSLTEAELLSVADCSINASNAPLFENGILRLPNIDVFDDFNNSTAYEVEFSIIPFSNPLSFNLLRAQVR